MRVQGVVHVAETLSKVTAHLTIGFHRGHVQWIDVIRGLVANLTAGVAHGESSETKSHDNKVAQSMVKDTLLALKSYSHLDVGMHLQEAVPGWLLKCLGRALWYVSQ